MATYNMNRWASNEAQICKNGECYEPCDISASNTTWRAVQWDGAEGVAELCDGTDYDFNNGEQVISAESELQFLSDAWDTAKAAHEAELVAQAAAEAQDLVEA